MMETTFECRNGRTVTIMIDDENNFCTTVFDDHGTKLGHVNFTEDEGCLKLVRAYLDQSDPAWCRQGIGREILRQVKEFSQSLVVASDNDGMRHDDGSHLTGDAPAFVAKMREEGLILPSD